MKLITALATPYLNGKIDLVSFVKLLQHQKGVDGLLCCGTTAEGAFLNEYEKKQLLKVALSTTNATIWMGISNGVTAKAVKEAKMAKRWGAQGLLISPPAFFKCTQEGFVRHVLEIRQATKLPIMLYNAPSRCNYTLWKGALQKLFQEGVEFLKDAGNDILFAETAPQQVFCGNEEKLREFAPQCVGVVSVVSNVAPNLVKNAMTFATNDTLAETQLTALKKFEKLAKLAFCEVNPIAIKYMLHKEGIFESYEMRLPLTPASQRTQKLIDDFWKELQEKLN